MQAKLVEEFLIHSQLLWIRWNGKSQFGLFCTEQVKNFVSILISVLNSHASSWHRYTTVHPLTDFNIDTMEMAKNRITQFTFSGFIQYWC